MSINELRLALQDRNLSAVSRNTGLHFRTLLKFARNDSYIPRADFIDKLRDYLEERP